MRRCAPVLLCGSETMVCREKERSITRTVNMDNLRGLMGLKRMDRGPNVRKSELCGVTKGVGEKIDESVPDGSAILKEWGMIGFLKM